MYNKITNPKTGRKVLIYGAIGRNILKNYIKQIGGVYSPESYFTGLSNEERQKRKERMREGVKSDSDDTRAYRDFKTDFRNGKRIKTKSSRYTKQWEKYFPNAKSLEDKAKLTGVPKDIIEKVFNKGMAAWRTGHRPGANTHQWGYARVHSFLVKGKTYWWTDRKLAKEAMERSEKARKWFDSIDGLCDYDENRKINKWCDKRKICSKISCKD